MHTEGFILEDALVAYFNRIPENLLSQRRTVQSWSRNSMIVTRKDHIALLRVSAGRIESCLFCVNG